MGTGDYKIYQFHDAPPFLVGEIPNGNWRLHGSSSISRRSSTVGEIPNGNWRLLSLLIATTSSIVGEIPNGNWRLFEHFGSHGSFELVGEIPNGNWRRSPKARAASIIMCWRDTQWELATSRATAPPLSSHLGVGEIPNGNWRQTRIVNSDPRSSVVGEIPNGNWRPIRFYFINKAISWRDTQWELATQMGMRPLIMTAPVGEIPNGNWRLSIFSASSTFTTCWRDTQWELATKWGG